jgi:hypothetical protein
MHLFWVLDGATGVPQKRSKAHEAVEGRAEVVVDLQRKIMVECVTCCVVLCGVMQ